MFFHTLEKSFILLKKSHLNDQKKSKFVRHFSVNKNAALSISARKQLYIRRRLIDNNNYTVHIQTSIDINIVKLVQ